MVGWIDGSIAGFSTLCSSIVKDKDEEGEQEVLHRLASRCIWYR